MIIIDEEVSKNMLLTNVIFHKILQAILKNAEFFKYITVHIIH